MDWSASWNQFFSAEAGAAAALAGLLFVSVSINLSRILRYRQLPIRAAEGLTAFLSVLVVCTFALVPGQPPAALGAELAATGLALWTAKSFALAASVRISRRKGRFSFLHPRYILRIVFNQISPLPFVVGGGLLLAGRTDGLYWLVPGTLLSFVEGVFDAWVLLIEIQR